MFGYGVYMEFTPAGGNGGNQQIVLTAKTGFPRFSDVHGNGGADKQPVSYSIFKDSDGSPVEIGIGYLSGTSGGDQLERIATKIEATWAGSTYTKLPGSRVSLADGTTYRVYCSHQVNPQSLGYRACLGMTNQYQAPANMSNPSTGTLNFGSTTRLVAWPFLLLDGGPFDGFCFRPSTAINLDVALYRMRYDGDPGELVAGVATFGTTAAVVNEATFSSVKIDPGWYYAAMCPHSGGCSFWNESVAFGAIGAMFGVAQLPGMRLDYTPGTIPDPYGTPTLRGYGAAGSTGVTVPQVRLRRA